MKTTPEHPLPESEINSVEVGRFCKTIVERLCEGMEEFSGDYEKKRQERYARLRDMLEKMGIPFEVQESAGAKNIIVSFKNPMLVKDEKVLVTSHYDVETETPGANDNTSAVSVCLALAKHLKELRPEALGRNVQIVFFDLEERELQGSEAYCAANASELGSIYAVLNMEAVGVGDVPVLWPIYESNEILSRGMLALDPDIQLLSHPGDLVIDVTGDHNVFLARNIPSVCLTMVPFEDFSRVREMYSNDASAEDIPASVKLKRNLSFLADYHEGTDTPDKLQPEALKKAFRIIQKALEVLTR